MKNLMILLINFIVLMNHSVAVGELKAGTRYNVAAGTYVKKNSEFISASDFSAIRIKNGEVCKLPAGSRFRVGSKISGSDAYLVELKAISKSRDMKVRLQKCLEAGAYFTLNKNIIARMIYDNYYKSLKTKNTVGKL